MLRGNFFWTPPKHMRRLQVLMWLEFACLVLLAQDVPKGWLLDGIKGVGLLTALALAAYGVWLSSRYF